VNEESARLNEEELLYREGNVAIRGAVEIVSALPAESWALVTSASRRVAEMRLECAGLPAPPVLISSDDVGRGKPDPEGYLSAAERLGVAPERCLVIEDTPAGLEAARTAATQLDAAVCIADFTCVEFRKTEVQGKLRLELRVTDSVRDHV
jgi:sugar-phosphatase